MPTAVAWETHATPSEEFMKENYVWLKDIWLKKS